MPPTRNILSRRLSTYDPTIFNPPPTLRPSANRFYSWPRSLTRSQGTPSPPHGDSDASRIAKAAGKKVTIEDCYSEGSAGEEEVDQPDDDESDASDQREDTMEPSDQSSGNTSAPPTRATAQTTTTAPEPLRSSLKRRTTTQATGQAASPDPGLAAASTSRSGKPPSSQGATTRGGAPSASTDEDLGEATVNGPVVTRPGYKEYDLGFTINQRTLKEQFISFKCTTSESPNPLSTPPVETSEDRNPGDLHVHLYMGAVQLWLFKGTSWVPAEEGDPHPSLGKSRVLSHHEPHNTKLPNWVLHSSLISYHSRKRARLMQ